jgi:hypothetical protein
MNIYIRLLWFSVWSITLLSVFHASAQINTTYLNAIASGTWQPVHLSSGMLNTPAEIQTIINAANQNQEPWASAYDKLSTSTQASLGYMPSTWATGTLVTNGGLVWEGIDGIPDDGGGALIGDSEAAYTQALMWELTGNKTYATNAINIMNAWSSNLKVIGGANWYLVAAWSGSTFPLAAEIIRNNNTQYSLGWTTASQQQFSAMLDNVYLPLLNERYGFGNRELACCNALCAIGIFNNDPAAFYQGLRHWMSYFPCYVYMTADGITPPVANYWVTSLGEPTASQYQAMDSLLSSTQKAWITASNAYPGNVVLTGTLTVDKVAGGPYGDDSTGLISDYNSNQPDWYGASGSYPYGAAQYQGCCAETCRDLGHVENSIGSVFALTEMARTQGFDVYSGSSARLAAFLEMNSYLRLGYTMPGGFTISQLNLSPTYEIGYNHLANVLGLNLPYTQSLITNVIRDAQSEYVPYGKEDYWNQIWPAPPGITSPVLEALESFNGGWETVTHGNLNGGLPGPSPNVALNRAAAASSTYSSSYQANSAVDGNYGTRWGSAYNVSSPVTYTVDLGSTYNITGVTIAWNSNYATSYSIQTSTDDVNWTTVTATGTTTTGTLDPVQQLSGMSGTGRYVQIVMTQSNNAKYGYSIWEFKIFGSPTVPEPGNLMAYYPFNETANDYSGMGNNGVAADGLTYSTIAAGGESYSAEFNGTGARVDVPNSSSLEITGNLTLACWAYLNNLSSAQDLIAKSYNSGYRLVVTTSGQLELVLGNSTGGENLVYSTQKLSAGQWAQVAATVSFSGSTATVQFYVNGQPDTSAHTTSLSSINPGTGPLVMGCSEESDNQPLSGYLDQVLIYNTALTGAQVQALP